MYLCVYAYCFSKTISYYSLIISEFYFSKNINDLSKHNNNIRAFFYRKLFVLEMTSK